MNPKLINSNIIDCIPQSEPCPLKCPECYFNTYFEESFNDLPRIPNPKVVNEKGLIVRVNSGHDSNIQKAEVLKATKDYKHKFYNTSLPKLNGFPGPVVWTINPGHKCGIIHYDDIEYVQKNSDSLMFVRALIGIMELTEIELVRERLLLINEFVPVVITFMRYKDASRHGGYVKHRNIEHMWYVPTTNYKMFVMDKMCGTGIRMCGTLYSNLCVDCGVCEEMYWAWTRR